MYLLVVLAVRLFHELGLFSVECRSRLETSHYKTAHVTRTFGTLIFGNSVQTGELKHNGREWPKE
jgi:hypothetical protein